MTWYLKKEKILPEWTLIPKEFEFRSSWFDYVSFDRRPAFFVFKQIYASCSFQQTKKNCKNLIFFYFVSSLYTIIIFRFNLYFVFVSCIHVRVSVCSLHFEYIIHLFIFLFFFTHTSSSEKRIQCILYKQQKQNQSKPNQIVIFREK